MAENADQATLKAYSAYDLPSMEALVRYFRAAAGFPVRATWLDAIKAVNYRTWPGLTLANATAYCPSQKIPSKATWSSHRRESDPPITIQLYGRSLLAPSTMRPSPPQIRTNFTCTQYTSVNYLLMTRDATLSRQEAETNISWLPIIVIPT